MGTRYGHNSWSGGGRLILRTRLRPPPHVLGRRTAARRKRVDGANSDQRGNVDSPACDDICRSSRNTHTFMPFIVCVHGDMGYTQHTHSYTRILGSGLPSPRYPSCLCVCVYGGTDGRRKGTCEYVFNTFAFITVKMFAAHVILCPVLPSSFSSWS